MAVKTDDKNIPKLEEIVNQLLASENICDKRKGSDLLELLQLSRSLWQGRFDIVGIGGSAQERALVIVCAIQATGLIWADGGPKRHNKFICTLGIPHNYPLSKPNVRFLRDIPFCCHVVHREFVPEAKRLSSRLYEYLRNGEGCCCYIQSADWTPSLTLSIVLWQVSQLLTFAKSHGEAGSLNPAARDYMQRCIENKLPLGKSLPYPHDQVEILRPLHKKVKGKQDIEWISEKFDEVAYDAS